MAIVLDSVCVQNFHYLMGKNVIIIGVDMSSLVHFDNKEKHILILGKCPTQRLDDTKLTAEAIQLIFQDLVKIFLEPAL